MHPSEEKVRTNPSKCYVRLSEIEKSNQEIHQQIPLEHIFYWTSWAGGAIVLKLETNVIGDPYLREDRI